MFTYSVIEGLKGGADLSRDHEMTERFLIEAQAASSIGHPHIIEVHQFFKMEKDYYVVLEYMRGGEVSTPPYVCCSGHV